LGAEAVVDAVAEGDVLIVRAGEVDLLRTLEIRRVR
jgi:hypothetical protein